MKTFCILGGEQRVKGFRRDLNKAYDINRTIAIKFFQLKANLLITEIEYKLEQNEPINLDITSHFDNTSRSLSLTDFVVNVCWGWGKLSYSQVSTPDLVLFIYPDGNWEYYSGNTYFKDLKEWSSVSEMIIQVYQSIIFDVLKLNIAD